MALTLRLVKGSPLTNSELDGNFSFLNSEVFGRARFGSGAPANSLGVDGDFYIRIDAPYDGVLYIKAAGTWAATDSTYTWAEVQSSLLPASNYDGSLITVSDWGVDFVSAGGYWRPINKRLLLTQDVTQSAVHTGTVAQTTLASLSVPGGLVYAGCRLEMSSVWQFTGGAGTKTVRNKIESNAIASITASAANLSAYPMGHAYFTAANAQVLMPSGSNPNGASNSPLVTLAFDFAVARTLSWSIELASAADTAQLFTHYAELVFP